jgi:hypothetical protein
LGLALLKSFHQICQQNATGYAERQFNFQNAQYFSPQGECSLD